KRGGKMGVKWRNFEMPKKLECDESTYSDSYAKFTAEPFERGYGISKFLQFPIREELIVELYSK
ncbi:unnamed protein product, partial [marine sediment metagenome]